MSEEELIKEFPGLYLDVSEFKIKLDLECGHIICIRPELIFNDDLMLCLKQLRQLTKTHLVGGIIYKIKNLVNGKQYVGQTIRPSVRLKEHEYNASKGDDKMVLYDAIRKYGIDSFELEELETCKYGCDLDVAEIEWIEKLGTFGDGYNMTKGGHGIRGYTHTPAAKKSMSINRSGKKNHNYGKFWGKKGWTEEEIQALREKLVDHPNCHKLHTQETKDIIRTDSSSRRKLSIAVHQLDKQGNIITTFSSISKAAKAVNGGGMSIKMCCEDKNNRKTHMGYRWRYVNKPKATLVAKCCIETGEILQTFKLVIDATKETGVSKSGISKVLCGNRNHSGGYFWKYVDDTGIDPEEIG